MMGKGRLEAFSDGVLAIIITIMVLELKVPHGDNAQSLIPLIPIFFSYILSFIYVGIYWNNHHHLLHATQKISGGVLWANLHLLFWLSLIPFVTGWMGENHFAPMPVAFYGGVLLMSAIAFTLLQWAIIKTDEEHSQLKAAIGKDIKGKISVLFYVAAIGSAYMNTWISGCFYVLVALIWLVPDKRFEHVFAKN